MPPEFPTLALSALTIGLLGSLHCAGMCGPLCVAVACAGPERSGQRLGLFVAGKAVTYFVLGVVAATVGAAFGSTALGTRPFAVLAVGAGVGMVLFGAHALGRFAVPRKTARPGPLSVLISSVLGGPWARRTGAAGVAGLLAGLLPCGLVYAMTAQSLVVGVPLWGGLLMVAFGLGTAPSLLTAGWLSSRVNGRARRVGELLAASGVVVMGVLAAWRGVAMLMAASSTPPCCH